MSDPADRIKNRSQDHAGGEVDGRTHRCRCSSLARPFSSPPSMLSCDRNSSPDRASRPILLIELRTGRRVTHARRPTRECTDAGVAQDPARPHPTIPVGKLSAVERGSSTARTAQVATGSYLDQRDWERERVAQSQMGRKATARIAKPRHASQGGGSRRATAAGRDSPGSREPRAVSGNAGARAGSRRGR